jgi:hypothetical protein
MMWSFSGSGFSFRSLLGEIASMKIGILAAAAVVALAAQAASANATILHATYTGTVYDGIDPGFFGPSGADLTGDAFTLVYTIDTTQGAYINGLPAYDELYGGSQYALTTPVSGKLTINGQTVSVAGNYFSEAYTADPVPYTYHKAMDDVVAGSLETETILEMSSSAALDSVFHTLPPTSAYFYGTATFYKYDSSSGTTYYNTNVSLDGTGTVQVTAASDVPEPAAWAIMLLGMAGLGAALRSRRRSLATAV